MKKFKTIILSIVFIILLAGTGYAKLDYQPVYAKEFEQTAQVTKKVKKIIKKLKIKEKDSLYTKVKKVHDWLIDNLEYDHLVNDYYFHGGTSYYTAEQVQEVMSHEYYNLEWILDNNTAVCSGYSSLFKVFMNELGIDCLYVSSKKMNHAWNMVKMDDGHWYHIDVTWDDVEGDETAPLLGGYGTTYFLRNDENFLGHYSWDKDTPKADGDYYEKNVNHDISYAITSKDKYWKNGKIKVCYGNSPLYTDCVSKFYKNGNLKYTKYTDIELGSKIIMKYNKNGIRTYRKIKYSSGLTYEYKGKMDYSGAASNINCKIYRKDGSLEFDYLGEISNYAWNGKGIVSYYDEEGNLVYTHECDFVNYARTGKGVYTSFNPDGSIKVVYEGEFENNRFNGKGTYTEYREDGSICYIYEGTFVEGVFEGTGKFTGFLPSGIKMVSEGLFSDWSLQSGITTWYDTYGQPYKFESC